MSSDKQQEPVPVEVEVEDALTYYANILARDFTSVNDPSETSMALSTEQLLFKWCSTPPTPKEVDAFALLLKARGFEPVTLDDKNSFNLVYLLKRKA